MEKITHIALLRGINVGGKNSIKMETLQQLFVDLGFSDVKTYIQSGNVIFNTHVTDKSRITKLIEDKIVNTFSVEIKTLILSANELQEIVEHAPAHFGAEPEKFRYDVWFLFPSIDANEILSTIRLREGVDTLHAGKNALFTTRLSSEMNRSYLPKIIGTPLFQHITVRNWNTARKLMELINQNNKR